MAGEDNKVFDDRLHGGIIESRSDPAKEGFRLIGSDRNAFSTGRDLSPAKHDKMQRNSLFLFQSSPVAQRIIEIRKSLILSEGFNFEPKGSQVRKNKILQEFLQKFWEDNRLDEKLDRYVQDLLIFGELAFYVPNINPYNGKLKVTWLSPELIESVTPDQYDLSEMDEIVLKDYININEYIDGDLTSKKTRTLKIIRENSEGVLEGNAFYLALNKTVGATRGICDFVHVSDWIDVHNKILLSESDRVEFSKAFIFKCRVEGGEHAVRSVIERQSRPPAGGSVLVHSEREEWSVLQPQLTLFDTKDFSQHLLSMILGGMGIPEHWWFSSSGSNKSVSAEMTEPIFMWARKTKKIFCSFLKLMLSYAVQEAREGQGPLNGLSEEDCDFEVISRDPDRGAYDEIGKMLTEVGGALNLGVSSGWFDNDWAGATYRKVVQTLGLSDDIESHTGSMTNWNLELVKAKANEQFYENLQNDEGKAKLVARLFNADTPEKLDGEKPKPLSPSIQNFLKINLNDVIDGAKKDAEKKDAEARQSDEVKRQQAEIAKQEKEKALKDMEKQGGPNGKQDSGFRGNPEGNKAPLRPKPNT